MHEDDDTLNNEDSRSGNGAQKPADAQTTPSQEPQPAPRFVQNEAVKFITGLETDPADGTEIPVTVAATITAVHDDGTYDVQEVTAEGDGRWFQNVGPASLLPA